MMLQFGASLTDDTSSVNYYRNMFIIQATDVKKINKMTFCTKNNDEVVVVSNFLKLGDAIIKNDNLWVLGSLNFMKVGMINMFTFSVVPSIMIVNSKNVQLHSN